MTPGLCGCGVSDADSDGDGTVDCLDGCPTDPNKTAPGICGCGVPDDTLEWSTLAAGADNAVWELGFFNDGAGTALFLGGQFTHVNGVSANHVARWNGSTFSPLGSGTDGTVLTFAEYDDGHGPALYAGGFFTHAGGGVANDEILAEVGQSVPDVLLMFASSNRDAPNIRVLIDTIRDVAACPNMQIVVGGGIFNRAPGLAEEIGADMAASSPSDLLDKLISQKDVRSAKARIVKNRSRAAA